MFNELSLGQSPRVPSTFSCSGSMDLQTPKITITIFFVQSRNFSPIRYAYSSFIWKPPPEQNHLYGLEKRERASHVCA